MPQMQVYLSDELYSIVKSQGLSASSLLQDAVRQHCDRQEKIRAAHEYAEEVFAELGPPTAEEIEWAETKARRIVEWLSAGEQSDAKPPAISPTTPSTSWSNESDNSDASHAQSLWSVSAITDS